MRGPDTSPFAFWIVAALRPRLLVELGTHSGNSYLAFAQAVHRLGLDTACFAVDTWQGDAHAGYYGEEVFEALARHHDARYGSFSRLVRSTFDEAALQTEVNRLTEALRTADQREVIDALQHKVDEQLRVISGLQPEIVRLGTLRETERTKWQEQLHRAESERVAARGETETLRAALTALHQSRSLRLTSPFRQAAGWYRTAVARARRSGG